MSDSPFLRRLDNFWYHYKWTVLIAAFFLLCILIFSTQLLNTEDSDIHILYAGPHIFTLEEKTELEAAFSSVMSKDFNGDGVKNTVIVALTIMTEEQQAAAMENYGAIVLSQYSEEKMERSFTQEIFAGESVICLLDTVHYERVKNEGGFVALADVLGKKPEKALDDYGVLVSDTDLAFYLRAFDILPEDTVLCMRNMSVANAFIGKKAAEKKYEYHKLMLRDVLGFRLPAGFVDPNASDTATQVTDQLNP